VTEHRSAAGTSAQPAAESTPLVVRTVPVADPGPLLALLPDADATAWVHRGDGIVGWGVAAVLRTEGADRFERARDWWTEHARTAVVRDGVEDHK
jgi:menaquinone-specific isochorismate synthase